MCSTHRGVIHAKIKKVYHKSPKYAWSYILPKQAWNLWCKVHKTNKTKFSQMIGFLKLWNGSKDDKIKKEIGELRELTLRA